jgi:hypothetical protein
MSDVTVPLGGFGSLGWSVAAWGEGNISVVATGSVGSVTVLVNPVEVTGVSGIGFVGSVVAQAGANAPVTGLQAVGSVGSVTVIPSIEVFVVGVSCTASITSVSVWITINDSQTPNWVEIAA